MGKKKGKGKKKVVLTDVDRQRFKQLIVKLSNTLSKLRTQYLKSQKRVNDVTKELYTVQGDRVDVCAYLSRIIEKRELIIVEKENYFEEIVKLRKMEKEAAANRIKELEKEYKIMLDSMSQETKLLSGQLRSLQEHQKLRAELLDEFEEQRATSIQNKIDHRDRVLEMQKKAMTEKELLQKQLNARLQVVMDDFMKSVEIRNAGYVRRLIKENIMLHRDLDYLLTVEIKKWRLLNERQIKQTGLTEEFTAVSEMNEVLLHTCNAKNNLIRTLFHSFNDLKTKYIAINRCNEVMERKNSLIENYERTDAQIDMKKKKRQKEIEWLKLEKVRLTELKRSNLIEIERLTEIIKQIQSTIFTTMDAVDEERLHVTQSNESYMPMRAVRRNMLLYVLMNLVSTHMDTFPDTPPVDWPLHDSEPAQVYQRGKLGLVPTDKIVPKLPYKHGSLVSTSTPSSQCQDETFATSSFYHTTAEDESNEFIYSKPSQFSNIQSPKESTKCSENDFAIEYGSVWYNSANSMRFLGNSN